MFRLRHAKTIASCAALAVLALLLTLVLTHTGPAKPRPAPPTQSEVSREAIKPGNYATAINIHDPSLGGDVVTLYKRAVLAQYEENDQLPPSKFVKYSLGPGRAFEIDCVDIWQLLNIPVPNTHFTKGFVTILSRVPLDVVGVYSAEPPAVAGVAGAPSSIPGIALEMLPIAPRIEFLPRSAATDGTAGQFIEYSAKFLCGEATPSP
jgi:hypothetical protein